jgi:hypothetical protein
VHADRAREPGDPHQSLEPHADLEPGVIAAESLLDAQLLAVVRPPLDERLRVQHTPDRTGHVTQGTAV